MMRRLLLLFLFSYCTSFIFAQQYTCGNEHPLIAHLHDERTLANVKALRENTYVQPRNTIFVPTVFHLVANNDGQGRAEERAALLGLCQLNEIFSEFNIQFFLADEPFNYVNSEGLFINPGSFSGNLQIIQNFVPGVMNIFVADKIQFDPNSQGNTLGVYLGDRDAVVLIKDRLDGADKTLPHEIGHYLSLRHTFFGYENGPFTSGQAPDVSPGGTPTENMARTGECANCLEAADLICDTPPDYNFGITGASCRSFNLSVQDPCGEAVVPQGINYMSYFFNCDEDVFTPGQGRLMQQDVQTRISKRTINPSLQPAITEAIERPTNLTFPSNNSTVESFNQVIFEWEAVPNAEYYLLEIDRFSNFNVRYQGFLVKGTSKEVNTLAADQNYVWRVTPINSYQACLSNPSQIWNITTGATEVSVSNENQQLFERFGVSPNPLAQGQALQLTLESPTIKAVQVDIIDLAGRTLFAKELPIHGKLQEAIQFANNISNGLYVVKITDLQSKQFSIKKIIIQ